MRVFIGSVVTEAVGDKLMFLGVPAYDAPGVAYALRRLTGEVPDPGRDLALRVQFTCDQLLSPASKRPALN